MAIQVQLLLVGIEYVFAFQICYYELCVKKKQWRGADMWTHLHWAGVTRISRLSPAWKFKLHFNRITDVLPALPMFHPHSVIAK